MHKALRYAPLAATAVVLAATVLASAQQTSTAPGTHPISGRRFAGVMGCQGAEWLDRAERLDEEQPDIAIDRLKLEKGGTVEAKLEVESEGFKLAKVDPVLPRQHMLIFARP
ncbi:MAG: hypothetical protein GEU82_02310 [Luteitalea sp.]|nr:hypothetical protein [Luteitalea sp.]